MLNDPGPGETDASESSNVMAGAVSPRDTGSDEDEDTAFMPATIFPNEVKPGDTCTFKVVSNDDGQVELAYVSSNGSPETRSSGGKDKPWEQHLDEYGEGED